MNVCVIGLGEIGEQTFREMNKVIFCRGVDLDPAKVMTLGVKERYTVSTNIPISDIYVICVYSTDQVWEVINSLNLSNNPLVVIESTILPGTSKQILEKYPTLKLALFPHRYNPGDPEHHVFNLDRLLATSNPQVETEAWPFYVQFMSPTLIHKVSLPVAELSKPMENAYRFVEIVLAQEIAVLCQEREIDFNELRAAMNTKWNIDVREARDGIGGKCLPKDIDLIERCFQRGNIFLSAIEFNQSYIIAGEE